MFTIYIEDTLTGKKSKHIFNTKNESVAKKEALKKERKLRGLSAEYKYLKIISVYPTIKEDKMDKNWEKSLSYYRYIDNVRYK